MRTILEENSTPIVWEERVRKEEWVKRWRRQDLWGIVRGRDFAILDVERTLGTTRSTYLVLADILEVGKDEDVWFVDY